MTVGVLFGGPSPEHDISILTGLLALHELERSRSDVLGIYWT
jgi:D-alanine-D-alanine ligase